MMNNDDDDDRRDRKEWHDDTNLCTAFADKSCVARCILDFYFMAEKIEMAHVLVDNALFFFFFYHVAWIRISYFSAYFLIVRLIMPNGFEVKLLIFA